ncbi:MAG: SCP2 sterol-binding domain-containing protein [Lachnospiraceae bacterium]
MRIHIYYGGRGVIDDPTLFVIRKMEEVLSDLRCEVKRYALYESRNEISKLPLTFCEADGIILASTVEWFGIGGYMQQFLDSCWLYGDKDKISRLYMQPIVMSTTFGEKEGIEALENAWEILGGQLCTGFSGYVEDAVSFERNQENVDIIERHAENLYRQISKKVKNLPSSCTTIRKDVLKSKALELTPQESEQLSQFVSDESYVKRQREDLQELTSMFRGLLGNPENESKSDYLIFRIRDSYRPKGDILATFQFELEERQQPLFVKLNGSELVCRYSGTEEAEVLVKLKETTMEQIVSGKMTFQRAFMTGEMTVKGDFKLLQLMDSMFHFS